jgi:2-keto-3-deoxy-L-rhamnonate aldolase RhmA
MMTCETFRHRLTASQPVVGTFLKTPSAIAAEVLALSDLDVFCIDAEHAPFGRLELDACIAAFRTANRPSIVRISSDSPVDIRNALDCGATGIMVPHVTSKSQAESIVKASRFGDGGRGFAGSPRAASYTQMSMAEHIEKSNKDTAVIAQIEDLAALDNVADIASVDGIDCLFIGRADLAVGMQKSPMDDVVVDTVKKICAQSLAAGTPVGMFTPDLGEIPSWRELGATLFLLSSDQSFVIAGANQLAVDVRTS